MRKHTQKEFIAKASVKHFGKYDYSLVSYINGTTPIIIICPHHGSFQQKPCKHLDGRGCPLCTHNNVANNALVFVSNATHIHHGKYDYSLVEYQNARTKVIIICPKHGQFSQIPDSHLQGHGCPKCMAQTFSMDKRSTTAAFINAANTIHSNFYDYSKVEYKTAKSKVVIICPKHGPFKQTPDTHLKGCGCSSCIGVVSRIETLWLDLLGLPNTTEHRRRSIRLDNKLYRADGYDPITNTVYEFYGDYWHGHPTRYNPNDINIISKQTFGQLYSKTIAKEAALKTAGYNVVSIWETDFRKQIKNIGNTI